MSDPSIDSNISFSKALTLSRPRNYPKAAVHFCRALQKSPENLHILYFDWGNALINQFKYKAALSKYKLSAQISPNFSFAYNGWGTALFNLGDFDGAVKKFQKAFELDPNELLSRMNWSRCLYLTGNELRALVILGEGLRSHNMLARWSPRSLKVNYEAELQDLEWRKLKAGSEEEVKFLQKIIFATQWVVKMLSSK